MTTIALIRLGRTAVAVALLVPAAACAKPTDQTTASRRVGDAVPGVTLPNFVSRHERKLLADDTDGDGKVSRAEFLAAVKADKGDPAKRFTRLDTNGDGLLDRAEIEALQTRRFKRLDTNGDGVLSAHERAAAHARKAKNAGDGSDT